MGKNVFEFPKNLTPELEFFFFLGGGKGGRRVFPLFLLLVCLLPFILLNIGMIINIAVRKKDSEIN